MTNPEVDSIHCGCSGLGGLKWDNVELRKDYVNLQIRIFEPNGAPEVSAIVRNNSGRQPTRDRVEVHKLSPRPLPVMGYRDTQRLHFQGCG